MYKVEAILDKKFDPKKSKEQFYSDKVFYFIKWEGYDQSVSTWEPIEHLQDNCLEFIKAFDKENQHLKITPIGLVRIPQNPTVTDSKKGPEKNNLQKKKIIRKENKVMQKKTSSINSETKKLPSKTNKISKFRKTLSKLKPRQVKDKEQNLQKLRKSRSSPADTTKKKRPSDRPNKEKKSLMNEDEQKKAEDPQRTVQATQTLRQGSESKGGLSHSFERNIYMPPTLGRINFGDQSDPRATIQKVRQIVEPRHLPLQIKEQPVQILGMKKSPVQWRFYIEQQGGKRWESHEYLLDKHPRALCRFYEENLQVE